MQLNMNLRCPTCGRPFPPLLKVSGFVRERVLAIVGDRPDGVTSQEIYDFAYRNVPSIKLPKTGTKVIHVLVWNANRQLRPQGYEIRSMGRGSGARYLLVMIDANPKYEPARDQNAAGLEGTQSAGTAGLY